MLVAVGRVAGRVEVDSDHAGGLAPLALALQHEGGEGARHAQQVAGADGVLEAGESGLGGEVAGGVGVAPEQHLEDGIGAQAVGVVAVEVAEGDAEDALAQHVGEGMLDAGAEAGVAEAGDEGGGEAQQLVAGREQGGAAVGAGQGGVELGDDRLAGVEIGEQDALHGSGRDRQRRQALPCQKGAGLSRGRGPAAASARPTQPSGLEPAVPSAWDPGPEARETGRCRARGRSERPGLARRAPGNIGRNTEQDGETTVSSGDSRMDQSPATENTLFCPRVSQWIL